MGDLRFTPDELHAHIAEREATIRRAIDFVNRYGADSITVYCAVEQTQLHQPLKDDPAELVRKFNEALESGHTFGAWKGAQQVCQAAGLEY